MGIFAAEFLIKIIARGFAVGRHTYLWDVWNWLDFIILIFRYAFLFYKHCTSFISRKIRNLDAFYLFIRTTEILRVFYNFSFVSLITQMFIQENQKMDLNGLRAFRVFRVFRTFSIFPGILAYFMAGICFQVLV